MNFFSLESGWYRDGLNWLLGGLVLWAVAMVPAFMISRALRAIRQRLAGPAGAFNAAVTRFAEKRSSTTNDAFEDFRESKLARVVEADVDVWRQALTAMTGPLERTEAQYRALSEQVLRLREDAARGVSAIRGVEVDRWPVLEQPAAAASPTALTRRRIAALFIVATTTVLIAAIAANTGMLKQILVEIWEIPVQPVFGIELPVLLAVFVTVLEIGTGVVHAFLFHYFRGPVSRLAHVFWLAVPIGLALVEGYYYSQIAGDTGEPYTLPLVGVALRANDFFFILGFALVAVLFMCGHGVVHAAVEYIESGNARRLARTLRWIAADAERLGAAAQQCEEAAKATASLDLTGPSAAAGEAYSKAREALNEWLAKPPAWARSQLVDLTESEVRRLERRVAFWLLVAAAVAVAAILLSIPILGSALGVGTLAAAGAGLVQVVLPLVIGMLLRPDEIIVTRRETPGEAPAGAAGDTPVALAVSSSRLARYFAVALAAGAFVAYLGVMIAGAPAGLSRPAVAFGLILTAILIAAGRHLAEYSDLAAIYVAAGFRATLNVVTYAALAVVRTTQGAIAVLEHLAGVVAYPIELALGAFSHRRRGLPGGGVP